MDSRNKVYDANFYENMSKDFGMGSNLQSARQIVPYVMKLIPETRTVVDIGGL